jgi:hypothetical protein
MRLRTLRDDLLPNAIVVSTVHQSQINIVSPSRHQPVNDDDRFIGLVIDADEHSLPRGAIHINRQSLCKCIRDDSVLFSV